MVKSARRKTEKAALPTAEERAARRQRDLLGRNVRQQRQILRLRKQLSAALKRSDEQLAALVAELRDRLATFAPKEPASAGEPIS